MNRATARCLTTIAAMLVLLPLIVLGQQEEWTRKGRRGQTSTSSELAGILREHVLWVVDRSGGNKANLSGALPAEAVERVRPFR